MNNKAETTKNMTMIKSNHAVVTDDHAVETIVTVETIVNDRMIINQSDHCYEEYCHSNHKSGVNYYGC